MQNVKDMGFNMSSVFRYGLDFFSEHPEQALEWEEAQAREQVNNIWKAAGRAIRTRAGR